MGPCTPILLGIPTAFNTGFHSGQLSVLWFLPAAPVISGIRRSSLPPLSLMSPTDSSRAGTGEAHTDGQNEATASLMQRTSASVGSTDLLCDCGTFLPLSSLYKTRMIFSSAYLPGRGILSVQGDNGQ